MSREEILPVLLRFPLALVHAAGRRVRGAVRESGFRGWHIWGENADRFFPDTEAMVNWVDQPSLVPFLACVAEEDKALFREFVVGRMIEETKQPDGKCFETFRRVNVFARKSNAMGVGTWGEKGGGRRDRRTFLRPPSAPRVSLQHGGHSRGTR